MRKSFSTPIAAAAATVSEGLLANEKFHMSQSIANSWTRRKHKISAPKDAEKTRNRESLFYPETKKNQFVVWWLTKAFGVRKRKNNDDAFQSSHKRS